MKQNKMMKDVSKIFTKAKKSFADKLFEFLFAVLYFIGFFFPWLAVTVLGKTFKFTVYSLPETISDLVNAVFIFGKAPWQIYLAYLIYLFPILAALIVVLIVLKKPTMILSIITGALPILIFIVGGIFLYVKAKMSIFSLAGAGLYIMAIAGIGLIISAIGLLKTKR